MQTNFLKLDCDESDIIIIGHQNQSQLLPRHRQHHSVSLPIRNLGVMFDSNPSFEHHVEQITRTAFFHLKNIARLCPSLSSSAAETLINDFIT